MNITKAQYVKSIASGDTSHIHATIDDVEMDVPVDPANRHYAAILEWAEEDGNTIQEAD